jgi:hypothetical protein
MVTADSPKTKLPRRDWVILPLLSILTVGIIFLITEVTTRLIFAEGGKDSCKVRGPIPGQGNKPNCTARIKSAEGPWVEYTFNDCGYRTAASCGPRSTGTLRVALLGASLSEAYMIPYDQTFATQAAGELSSICDRPVEFQNMGTAGCWPVCAGRRVSEALALRPDAVMLAIAPFDVSQDNDPNSPTTRRNLPPRTPAHGVQAYMSPIERLVDAFSGSRTMFAAKHFLYQDEQAYVRLYLLQGDNAGFLRQPFTPAWEKRFSDLDLILGKMADEIHAAGVPFVLTAIPEHAQAILLGLPKTRAGVDPYAFERRIARIAAKHGIVFIDVFDDFAKVPDANSLYYLADGHLAPAGQSVVSRAIVRGFLSGNVPVFSRCTVAKPAS